MPSRSPTTAPPAALAVKARSGISDRPALPEGSAARTWMAQALCHAGVPPPAEAADGEPGTPLQKRRRHGTAPFSVAL
eukprot:CAMPEP_0198578030 /NCGR_PEP_ID=MMETSP1462-20131121/119693_1 /TAXON_ID=1333877 /ORGANISM="Brandtodinium nutriculum, Strain RCC3387" /LENGTH=77 /DNA_ID=CAMNT_0044309319 /DNA_START=1 /DNA_END=230 /DNA_ORIENTATION=-